jgi:hypothetical protein
MTGGSRSSAAWGRTMMPWHLTVRRGDVGDRGLTGQPTRGHARVWGRGASWAEPVDGVGRERPLSFF